MYCPACGHQKNMPGSDECANCKLPLTGGNEPALHDRVERSLMTEPVSVLGSHVPVTVPDDAEIGRAIRTMIERNVGAVLVTAADGRLAGILTERDFLSKVAGQPGFTALGVREFMTANPETVTLTDTLAFAIGKMDAGGYRHLPIVDGIRPVGVISVRDILRHVTHLC
jgi:CBS domain-containing protein